MHGDDTIRSVEVLFTLSSTCVPASDQSNIVDRIQIGREAVSVGQHHDSIVGTMLDGKAGSDDVLGDYIQQLTVAQTDIEAMSGYLADAMCICHTHCSRMDERSTLSRLQLPPQKRYVRAQYRDIRSSDLTGEAPTTTPRLAARAMNDTILIIKVFNSLSFAMARVVNVSLPERWRNVSFAVIDVREVLLLCGEALFKIRLFKHE